MSFKVKVKNGLHSIFMMLKEEKKIPIPTQVNTTKLLEGKIALITGGSGGIGMAIAENFLKNGAKVIIAGTSETKLKSCKDYLRSKFEEGTNESITCIEYIVLNVLDVDTIPYIIKKASEVFEEKRIDILVNSAGILNRSDFWHMSEMEYDSIMDINVKGTFFMCQAMGTYMIEHRIKGHILNVSSSSALRPAWTPYQMSKWAIRGFTLGLADTLLPYNIIVNAIAPGPVATAMLDKGENSPIDNPSCPIKRYAEPQEIANLAVFMVSDMGEMIVGDTFYITGGSGTISYQL